MATVFCLALAGFAQARYDGTITGTVTDVRGSRVIGQTVLVRNKASKLIFEAPLGAAGEYCVAVPAGTYELVFPGITLPYLRYVPKADVTDCIVFFTSGDDATSGDAASTASRFSARHTAVLVSSAVRKPKR